VEFSGATLGKGLNRGMATLLAGALGIGAHYLAGGPILILFLVFLQGIYNRACTQNNYMILTVKRKGKKYSYIQNYIFCFFIAATISTFLRFFPKIKARYDYGMLIFILTFSMITVSGFRQDQILELAHKRLSTVSIGAAACVIVSIVVFPVWAGEDLHNLIALNIEKLGNSLEGMYVPNKVVH
jgi:hypothetical protein